MSGATEHPVPDISFVMPCYNEQEVLPYTIPQLVKAFESSGHRLELVACDNGSTDRTGAILREFASQGMPLVLCRVEKNEGYGNGVLQALPLCSAPWVGIICSDGQVDAEDVVRLFDAVKNTNPMVLAKVRRRFRLDGLWRKAVSIAYNLFVFILWPRLGSIDVNGTPKILHRDVLRRMDLQSKRWFLDPEIMVKAHYMGVRVLEMNAFARMRGNGLSHVRATTCWEFFTGLLRFRFGGGLSRWRAEFRRTGGRGPQTCRARQKRAERRPTPSPGHPAAPLYGVETRTQVGAGPCVECIPKSDDSDSQAESAFAEFLARVDSGEERAFEALCRARPELETVLRQLRRDWLKISGVLGASEVLPRPPERLGEPTTLGPTTRGRATRERGAETGSNGSRIQPGVGNGLVERIAARSRSGDGYTRREEIARGGMGLILKVWDSELRRTLAMKVMRGTGLESPSSPNSPSCNRKVVNGERAAAGTLEQERALSRFLEEAQITGQLDHPGIVPVHELGVDGDGRVYFTMPLVRGSDLKQIMKLVRQNDPDWSVARVLNVFIKVSEAVAYAHSKGVLHRDLKPGNVMVGRFGETYVMDWGLARVMGRRDVHGLRVNRSPRKQSEESRRLAEGDGKSRILPTRGIPSPVNERRSSPSDVPSPVNEVRSPPANEVRSPLNDAASIADRVTTERAEVKDHTPDSPLITMDGEVVGTPSYMAPEQAQGRIDELGPRSEVYSIGAMLYHLLTGRMPYVDPGAKVSGLTVLGRLLRGPPKPVLEVDGSADPDLAAICQKAMARDPADRYRGPLDLARDLEAFLGRRPVSARNPTFARLVRLSLQRHRAVVTTAAAGLLAMLVATGLFIVHLSGRAQSEREARHAAEGLLAEKGRLLDVMATRGLLQEEGELFPAVPENAPAIERWVARAEDVLSRREHYAQELDAARTGPAPPDEELAGLIPRLELLASLRTQMRTRLDTAQNLEQQSIQNRARAWEEAIRDIQTSPIYGGLALKPQLGLAPLRKHQDTGLWEFWHCASGQEPPAEDHDGVAMRPEAAMVLVLLPGGTFQMGSLPGEPPQLLNEAQREVALQPFFVGKYEVTQAQWQRAMGENPAHYNAISPLHPVESVNWFESDDFARRMDLMLPTEEQWEYACRAGTTTPFLWGTSFNCLDGRGNYLDRDGEDFGRVHAPWSDGAKWHAAVGSYPANLFGLHDMDGNVMEWCANWYIDGGENEVPRRRAFRGASWLMLPDYARPAFRQFDNPRGLNQARGVRIARDVRD